MRITFTVESDEERADFNPEEFNREEYLEKMDDFVIRRTNMVKSLYNEGELRGEFKKAAEFYKK